MTMLELMYEIVGIPANDVQATMLYMACCCLAALFFYFALYLFKLVANSLHNI